MQGRWTGVRGRLFVRPALTLTAADGTEYRALASLDDKPWAVHDGEPWRAVFTVTMPVDDADLVELSVAPDITVVLRGDEAARDGGPAVAGEAAAPRAKAQAPRRRPSARALDAERLTARVTALQAALEREERRRAEAEAELDHHRAEGRQASAELARLRAELELAEAARRESEATVAQLDAARREIHILQRRLDDLAAARQTALAERSRLQEELRERSGALESARDALASEREKRESLREEREDRPERDPAPAPARSPRPLGTLPAPRANWGGRLLALLVIAAFLVAVYLVLHTTVLH